MVSDTTFLVFTLSRVDVIKHSLHHLHDSQNNVSLLAAIVTFLRGTANSNNE